MNDEEWVNHYRNMKPSRLNVTSYHESMIINNLERVLNSVKPPDADEIRRHVAEMINRSPYTNYCGD